MFLIIDLLSVITFTKFDDLISRYISFSIYSCLHFLSCGTDGLIAKQTDKHTDGRMQWLKWFCEAGGGALLMKPGWSKPHTHSNPTNLALFRHKITLYRFNQGGS